MLKMSAPPAVFLAEGPLTERALARFLGRSLARLTRFLGRGLLRPVFGPRGALTERSLARFLGRGGAHYDKDDRWSGHLRCLGPPSAQKPAAFFGPRGRFYGIRCYFKASGFPTPHHWTPRMCRSVLSGTN